MSAAMIRCDNCDNLPHRYLWSCDTCDQRLCQSCELEWHRPAKLASHPRERIEIPIFTSSSIPLASSSTPASSVKVRPASAVKRTMPAQPDEQVYCVCRQPDDGKRMMINCNSCDEWYHVRCVGLTEQQAEMLFTYKCTACTKANKKALPETNTPLLLASNSSKFRLLDTLPHDLLFHTLSFVGSQQLANLSVLNRHANQTFSHPLVWEQFLLVRYRTYAALSVAASSMGLGSNLDFDNTDFRYLARRLSEAPSDTMAQLQLEQLALENKQLAQRLQDQQIMQQRIKRRQEELNISSHSLR